MNKEEIIIEFVNSENFTIIQDYISKPYEETIEEIDKENTNLKQALNEIKELVSNLKDDYESFDFDIVKEHKEKILQIIDKVGGNE